MWNLRFYDNQSKGSTYKGLTYLKNRVATNQKRVIEAQKPKEQKHNAKENQTIEGKRRRKRSKKKQKSTGKEGLKW